MALWCWALRPHRHDPPGNAEPLLTDITSQLSTALADLYAIEREGAFPPSHEGFTTTC